jgi:hypothetical protein
MGTPLSDLFNKCHQGIGVLGMDFHKVTITDERGKPKDVSCDSFLIDAGDGKGGPERWRYPGTNLLNFDFLFYRATKKYVLPPNYTLSMPDEVL